MDFKKHEMEIILFEQKDLLTWTSGGSGSSATSLEVKGSSDK